MSYRKLILLLIIIALILFSVSLVLTTPSYFGLCPTSNQYCFDPYDEVVAQPVGTMSFVILVVLVVLLFLHKEVFYVWLKFVAWFIPLSAISISIMPINGGSLFLPGPDKESTTWLMSGILSVVSVIIILVKLYRIRENVQKHIE